ncbi:MAG: hypothetical protein ACPGK1_15205 [bacterium]
MVDIKKNLDFVKKNLDEMELLEDLSSTGTWYLDLRSMRFTEISEKIFELYGISKGDSTSYESFLFDCVLMDDQAYCEQKRLEIMNAKGPAKFKLEFRIIRQNTGAIHKQRVLVQRVEDEMGNLIGLRGAEMDLGIVEGDEPLR